MYALRMLKNDLISVLQYHKNKVFRSNLLPFFKQYFIYYSCSFSVYDYRWSMGTRYSLENILVICAIVGLCLLIIAIVTLISIFTSRWRYTMSREHDLGDSRYDNTIISRYEGDSSMWTTEGTFRTLEEI